MTWPAGWTTSAAHFGCACASSSSLCSLSDAPGVVVLPSPPEPFDSCRLKSVTGELVVVVSASDVAERLEVAAIGGP